MMSGQSSVLAPGRQARIASDGTGRLSMTWLALAAAAVLLVALGAWAMLAGRTATTPAAASGGSGHAAPFTSSIEQAIANGAQAAGGASAAWSSGTVVATSAAGRTVRVPTAGLALENATQFEQTSHNGIPYAPPSGQ